MSSSPRRRRTRARRRRRSATSRPTLTIATSKTKRRATSSIARSRRRVSASRPLSSTMPRRSASARRGSCASSARSTVRCSTELRAAGVEGSFEYVANYLYSEVYGADRAKAAGFWNQVWSVADGPQGGDPVRTRLPGLDQKKLLQAMIDEGLDATWKAIPVQELVKVKAGTAEPAKSMKVIQREAWDYLAAISNWTPWPETSGSASTRPTAPRGRWRRTRQPAAGAGSPEPSPSPSSSSATAWVRTGTRSARGWRRRGRRSARASRTTNCSRRSASPRHRTGPSASRSPTPPAAGAQTGLRY